MVDGKRNSPQRHLAERREIDAVVKASVKPSQFRQVYIPMFTSRRIAQGGAALRLAPAEHLYPSPPYWEGGPGGERTLKDAALALLPDNITTDHLPPRHTAAARRASTWRRWACRRRTSTLCDPPRRSPDRPARHLRQPQLVNEMAVVNGAVKKGSLARVEPEAG